MFKKITLRQKIMILRLIVVTIAIIVIYPVSNRAMDWMVRRTMQTAAKNMTSKLMEQKDEEGLLDYIKDHQFTTLFYKTLLNDKLEYLYDSRYVARDRPKEPLEQEGLLKAFEQGANFELQKTKQPWVYAAYRFYFHDKPYVLMASLTDNQVHIWVDRFQNILFVIVASFMVFAGMIAWWGVSRIIEPLFDIARIAKPYALGKTDILPFISIYRGMGQECKHLATTLNSLYSRFKEQSARLDDEKNEKEIIIEPLLEGVITLDAAGFVRYANNAAANLFNAPRRQLIGKPFEFTEAHPRINLFRRCQQILKLAQEQNNIVTDTLSIGDSPKIHLDLIAIPKNKRGAILILQDKSSHYKVIEMGKDFIANASHELRTPITIIKGYAETLQDLPSVSIPMLSEITEKIVRNCHRMDTLVKNLLTLADIEYVPESRFQLCDIAALADNCRHYLLTLSPTAKIDIEKTNDRIMAEADPDLLELALMNLLENGIKYSTPPAHLTIFLKEQGEEVLIAIQDRGIGIPKDDLPHIFERFYTVDKAHSRRLGGAGLGLSIVQTIIDKHEGTVSVASVVGQGTTFTVLIPQRRHAYLSSLK